MWKRRLQGVRCCGVSCVQFLYYPLCHRYHQHHQHPRDYLQKKERNCNLPVLQRCLHTFNSSFSINFADFFLGGGVSRLKSEAKDSWEVSILGVVWKYGLESKVLHEREIQTQVQSLSSHIEVSTLENGESFNLGDLDLNQNSDFSHPSPPQPLFRGKYQILGQKFLLKVQCFLSPVLCISLWRLAH